MKIEINVRETLPQEDLEELPFSVDTLYEIKKVVCPIEKIDAPILAYHS